MNEVQKLEPCPFCPDGGNPGIAASGGSDERNGYNFEARVSCGKCGASIGVSSKCDRYGWCIELIEDAKRRAATAWNRHADSALTRERDAMREALTTIHPVLLTIIRRSTRPPIHTIRQLADVVERALAGGEG